MPAPRALLAAAASLLALALAGCGASADGRPDVILVVVDTLRADGLSCYGNPRPTTPGLDRLAAEGVRFEEALAQAPNTATSHATLFTGLAPWTHRVANLTSLERGTAGLPPAFDTLAERFAAAGYRTAAITDGGPLGTSWNLQQGFELHRGVYEGVHAKVDQALDLLAEERDGRPLFLFLHTYEVHQPFVPPAEWVELFDSGYDGPLRAAVAEVRRLRAAEGEDEPNGKILLRDQERWNDADRAFLRTLYDAEIAYTDAELGRIWMQLRSTGALGRTALVVTSDHGEEFGEHGHFGHVALHRETLRVPLILHLPGGRFAGRTVTERVGLIDLFPTLLGVAALDPGPGRDGIDLVAALEVDRLPERALFAETTEHLYTDRPDYPWRRAARFGSHALLDTVRGEETELERLRVLPGGEELAEEPSAPTRPFDDLAGRLREHLTGAEARRAELLQGAGTVFVQRPDEDTLRELGALGYGGEERER